jgi:hypothetical protein
MGEMDGAAAEQVRAHLTGCTRCSQALGAMRGARDEPLPPLRLVPAQPMDLERARRRRKSAAAAGLGLAAAAASLLLFFRPVPGERAKGPGLALGMYVQHGGEVRRAGPDEVVAAGDAVRFAVTTPVKAYVAVLSLDPKGHASIYYPLGARAEPVPAGAVSLPLGTKLDATVGEERIVGLFCSSPVELEPVRARLESGSAFVPDGCQVTRWSFVKR